MAICIRRREFIGTLLVGAASWPPAARAEQTAHIPRIGIVDDAPMWQSFRQALREHGYVEGQSVNYEYHYSEGAPDRLAVLMGELVRRPVDLIAVYGTPPTEAAKAATATIPIVMVGVADPVRAGLVASLAHPGGNITGNTVLSPDLGAKRLQLLREAIPTVARVAYLTNPDNPATLDVLAELKLAAAPAGMARTWRPAGSWPMARACPNYSSVPRPTCTASCRAPSPLTFRLSCQPSLISRLTSRLHACSVSTRRLCSLRAPTRSSNECAARSSRCWAARRHGRLRCARSSRPDRDMKRRELSALLGGARENRRRPHASCETSSTARRISSGRFLALSFCLSWEHALTTVL